MKVRILVREGVSTECHKHAPTLPSSSGLLALVFSSYVLGNGGRGGEERREGGRNEGSGGREGGKEGDTGWL